MSWDEYLAATESSSPVSQKINGCKGYKYIYIFNSLIVVPVCEENEQDTESSSIDRSKQVLKVMSKVEEQILARKFCDLKCSKSEINKLSAYCAEFDESESYKQARVWKKMVMKSKSDERRKTLLYSVSDIVQDAKMEKQEMKIEKFAEAFTQVIPYMKEIEKPFLKVIEIWQKGKVFKPAYIKYWKHQFRSIDNLECDSKAFELQTMSGEENKMVAEDVGGEHDKIVSEEVDGHLQLIVLVSHLASCQAYSKVVEVCLAAATKRDPSHLAVCYYNNGENSEDTAGMSALQGRYDCYKHCTAMLNTLLKASSGLTSPGLPASATATLTPDQATTWAEQVFHLMLSSSDQLLHVALYHWLIENKYIDKLININSPHIEEFLKRVALNHPDLLWKYYEKTSQYIPAARSQYQYLSRILQSIKCSEGGSADSTASQVLHNVEEKMEFARVHLQELEAKSEKPDKLPTNNALSEADEMLSEVGIYYLVGVDWFFLFSLI